MIYRSIVMTRRLKQIHEDVSLFFVMAALARPMGSLSTRPRFE